MEEKKKDCNTCKKGLNKTQWSLFALSMYMFITSLYATYILINKLILLF